ncbi:MAG: tyrosine--tRNA ligase, partial [Bacteroidales bacterium]
SPYAFYQFWLNVSDADAEKYIKIFTTLTQEQIAQLLKEQTEAAYLRPLQKALAKEVTTMVHSAQEYEKAVEASNILFGNATSEILKTVDEQTFLDVFEGVPIYNIKAEQLPAKASELCVAIAPIFPSKGVFRKLVQSGGISINKEKLNNTEVDITPQMLLNKKYLLIQKGKKNYFLIRLLAQ